MRSKKIFIFFCCLLLSAVSFAQSKLSFRGKITDAITKFSLPGASVFIADIKLGAVADNNGEFIFTNIPVGHHLIEITHTGYTSIVGHIDIDKNLNKEFFLQPAVVENRGVIITGVANATSVRKSPVPVSIIRKSDLLKTAATNIIDLLAKQPGISQLQTGPGISKPVIRGLGYNRVVVINDGVRQEGQQWGDEHGIEIDEASVSKVEILKGPASLMYGSDALAGVINFMSNVPVAEGTIKGNIFSNYQTNNKLYSFHGNLTGNTNGFNWNAYISKKSAGDYKNKYDGRVLNSRFNEFNFGGYAGVNKSWGYSHLIFSRFKQNLGLVEGARDDATGKFLLFAESPLEKIATENELNSRKLFIPNQNINHYKIVSDNNFAISKSRLKINLAFQNNKRKEFGNPEDPSETELFFDLKTTNYTVQWVLPEQNEWRTSIGSNGMFQSNTNRGEEAIIPDYNLSDAGLFVYSQKQFTKTTISGGARFDSRTVNSDQMLDGTDIKFSAFKKTFTNFSGSIGITYEPGDNISWRLNLARGFRAPNLAELGSNGAHEGTNRYEYGDNNLKSETSFQADAGFTADNEHISFEFNTFFNRVNDFIYYRKLESLSGADSLVDVGGNFIEAFRFDQNNAGLYGFEITLDIHPHPLDWLHFENSLSFVRGKFDEAVDNSFNLPFIPAARLTTEIKTEFKKTGKSFRNLYVHLEMMNHFKQNKPFTAYGTETATPSYLLLNSGAGFDFVNKEKILFSLHLAVDNMTGKSYQNHLSRLKYTDTNNVTGKSGVYNTGRNFSIKLNIPLKIK